MSDGICLGRAELRIKNHHFNIKHIAKISKVLGLVVEWTEIYQNELWIIGKK